MATIVHTSDAREFRDGRIQASRRIAARLTIAEILARIIPPLLTVYPDGEVDLLSVDADDAASDLLQELYDLGYTIERRTSA